MKRQLMDAQLQLLSIQFLRIMDFQSNDYTIIEFEHRTVK